jgi:hypothetical protein
VAQLVFICLAFSFSFRSASGRAAACLTVAHARPTHRAGIHTATPKYLYKPTSAREIIEVLATCVTAPPSVNDGCSARFLITLPLCLNHSARAAKEHVKVVGYSNSPGGTFSPIARVTSEPRWTHAQRGGGALTQCRTMPLSPDIAVTDGYMISLENYRRVLSIDRKTGLVKVCALRFICSLGEARSD